MKKCLIFLTLLGVFLHAEGQKNYANSSVLSGGQWVKFSVEAAGVYKILASDLKSVGITGTISSAQIRLFGNGGGVLPESNDAIVVDDLLENAFDLNDGGDGSFDGTDYILFYAPGPNQWISDPLTGGFIFRKNPYSDRAFYFLQIGITGARKINEKTGLPNAGSTVNYFDEHLHHELDSINFLKSGKEWYGEQFYAPSGGTFSREFNLNLNTAVIGESFDLKSNVIGSTSNQSSKMTVAVNNKKILEHSIDPVPGSLISPVANESQLTAKDILSGSGLVIGYQHAGGSVNAKSWLNWFEIFFKRKLDLQGLSQLNFRLRDTVRRSYNFSLTNAANAMLIWDVTDPLKPQKVKINQNGSGISFFDSCNIQNEYIVFDPTKSNAATVIGKVSNQNLHQTKSSDNIIICDQSMIAQANRLKDYHQQRDGMSSMVVDIDQIYNEFSSGSPDPTALRNFIKMLYDRSASTPALRPKYLTLFGSASYVIKEKGSKKNSLVPSYQTNQSLDPLLSYVTDDYFGLLDDKDDINNAKNIPLLDVGIGRIPVRNLEQARRAVDKIIGYKSLAALGPWRNNITLVADDEDYNLHLDDAEAHAGLMKIEAPQFHINKIYLDAFQQESNAGGSRYPEVNKEVLQDINDGTLIWNYSGHGNNTRLAYEVVLDKDLLGQWKNENRLPFFITATCDFAPFDDQSQFSLGEDLFIGRSTGAIGLVTTTRLVFASSNKVMNNNFLSALTKRNQVNLFPSLGQALKDAKNITYLNSADFINVRKFTLLGDPALALAMPNNQIKTTSVQLDGSQVVADTLKALNKYIFTGEVLGPDGKLLSNFNGSIYPILYDKENSLKTRANDAESNPVSFSVFNNVLFKGKSKVESGKFSFTFNLPKDINYQFGSGKMIYYAENGTIDASGVDQNIVIGGVGSATSQDISGPDIKAYLDTISFKNGDEVGANAVLYVQLSDLSGMNLSQSSIGHQMVAVLDGDYSKSIVLNDFYTPDANTKGTLIYPFSNLLEGRHKLAVKAWDIFNNSSTVELDFYVRKSKADPIKSFIAFPNPFYDKTNLNLGLNIESTGYKLELDVISLDGKKLKNITQEINQIGLQSLQFEWDGGSPNGLNMQKGIYLVRVVLTSKEGKNVSKMLKLIKL